MSGIGPITGGGRAADVLPLAPDASLTTTAIHNAIIRQLKRSGLMAGSDYADLMTVLAPVWYARSSPAIATVGTNGTIVGAPVLVAGLLTGDPDPAMSYPLVGDYATVPSAAYLDLGDTFSLKVWVIASATGTGQYVFCKGVNAYALVVDETGHPKLQKTGVADGVVSTATVTNGARHLVVATRSPGAEHVYVDGVDVSSGSAVGTAYLDTTDILHVAAGVGGGYKFYGTGDEPAVFNRVLTQAEVTAIYVAGT